MSSPADSSALHQVTPGTTGQGSAQAERKGAAGRRVLIGEQLAASQAAGLDLFETFDIPAHADRLPVAPASSREAIQDAEQDGTFDPFARIDRSERGSLRRDLTPWSGVDPRDIDWAAGRKPSLRDQKVAERHVHHSAPDTDCACDEGEEEL